MFKYDYRDMVTGGMLVVMGAGLALYASTSYDMGTFRRLGPGAFPAAIGMLMAMFGAILTGQSFLRRGDMPDIRIWSPLFILSGVAAFALLMAPFGLIAAIAGCVAISSLADLKIRPGSVIGLTAGLALLSWLVFRLALGLPLVLFRWPF